MRSTLYGLDAAGAPSYNESVIFIIRSAAFSAAYPGSWLPGQPWCATGTPQLHQL